MSPVYVLFAWVGAGAVVALAVVLAVPTSAPAAAAGAFLLGVVGERHSATVGDSDRAVRRRMGVPS